MTVVCVVLVAGDLVPSLWRPYLLQHLVELLTFREESQMSYLKQLLLWQVACSQQLQASLLLSLVSVFSSSTSGAVYTVTAVRCFNALA